MKKLWLVCLAGILLLALCACAPSADRNIEYNSARYTDAEIAAAIDAATAYFHKNFTGCTLTEITYGGDERTQAHEEWAARHDADEVIVLLSSFDVDASGGDGSLNPNSTYDNWMWIMVRSNGGAWRHADHGY